MRSTATGTLTEEKEVAARVLSFTEQLRTVPKFDSSASAETPVPAVMIPVVGPKSYAEEQYYWGVKTDGILVHRALLDVWALRKMISPLRAGLSISSFGGAPILVRQNPSAAGLILSAQTMSRDSLNPSAAISLPLRTPRVRRLSIKKGLRDILSTKTLEDYWFMRHFTLSRLMAKSR